MFSKALFKQSCKANRTMWGIITFAVCFMLACVMLISGNGSIGEVKNSIQDTIITKEVDSQMQKRALSYYANADDGLREFDAVFSAKATDTLGYLVWYGKMPLQSDFSDTGTYLAKVAEWQAAMPIRSEFSSDQEYLTAMEQWKNSSPLTQENAVYCAYVDACTDLQVYIKAKAAEAGYEEVSSETDELMGSIMYALNPNGMFNDFYTSNGESVPSEYDVSSIATSVVGGTVNGYIVSEERDAYRKERAAACAPIFLAGNMIKESNVEAMTKALASYGVTKEKYESFGYTYDYINHMANTAIVTYVGRVNYELELIKKQFDGGELLSETEYQAAVAAKKQELMVDVSSSFLSNLPTAVSDALEEVGQADLYTLIVGSIFYKLAGLLLPIIYMIMASNNLIAGQVDSGSMAYVLSTSTKRKTVVFTQAVYLIGSLFTMFLLTTATGCVCLALVTEEVGLTYGNLILLNLGAFLVLLALSGLCFFTSCVFDRSKRSMAIGGGLSIFALVAAMLGLFGSPVIPSVVRLDALNYFNYTTIISLFDVISIIVGTGTFIWKFAILAVVGIIGYVAGAARFIKKDLPL